MDEVEWEDIDESAIEECMVLATQLYTQPPPEESKLTTPSVLKNGPRTSAAKHWHGNNDNNEGYFEGPGVSGVSNQECLEKPSGSSVTNGVADSDYLGSNLTGTKHVLKPEKRNGPGSFGKQRFHDLYMSNSSFGKSLVRGKSSQSQSKMYGPLTVNVAADENTTHMPSTSHSHQQLFKKDEQEQQGLLKKSEQEQASLNEKVQIMQGEISLLRAELKRKDTALESERLDRFEAIQAAEKKGREKAEKLVLETEAKAKESKMLVDKLQGELHFKRRETEELLNRCQQLEHKNDQIGTSKKRSRSEAASPTTSPNTARTKLLSRFDFGSGPSKVVNVEVQTESPVAQTSRRGRLPVAVSRGRGCDMRRTALLLSSDLAPTVKSSEGTGFHLPNEWSHIISQTLVESQGRGPWTQLVEAATERLRHIHSVVTASTEANRCDVISGDVVEWYEKSISGAVRVLDVGRDVCKPEQVLPLLTSHLTPHCIKDRVLNKRIRREILQATERVALRISHPIDKQMCDHLISTLRGFCECMEGGEEVKAVLRVLEALGHSTPFTNQLCSSGSCLVGAVCRQMRGVGEGDMEMASVMLTLAMNVVRQLPPWLFGSCNCPTLMLKTVITRLHHLLSSHSWKGCQGPRKLVVVLVRVLHAWSVVDPGWWDRVASLPHYPVFMSRIPSAVPFSTLDRHTADQLCELYEFDEGHLAADS